MDKKEYAISLHDRGCNCAQSVLCAFAKECGLDETILMKVSEGFGRGCGGMESMCGALSGAIMLAGLKYADGNVESPMSKNTTYAIADKLCGEFEKKCGSLICKELKGIENGIPLYPCTDCIKMGIELAEKVLGGEYDNN